MRITIDRNIGTIPADYSWQLGLGNDHAYQLHRTDVCEHIKLAHDELGIKYIRCHGILDDDMLTYQRMGDYRMFRSVPFKNKIEEINFRQVGHVYDNLLKCGVKPFVEISFMPSALAKGKKLGLRYNPNITMPKSLTKWSEYIKKFIRFLLDRYGAEEVESWYFEVWNEPDLSCFFAGSQKDYFKLYEATVRAIKEVNPNLRVGGPSTSACLWLEEFLAFCKENDVPCDFVSTHHYPGDAFGNFINLRNVKQYGSHDKARSDRFCVQDYTVWSAPVDDLSNWHCHGVTYRKDQDPRSKPGKEVDYYAPDCVRGNDGRYYLYYCAMGPNTKNFGPMSVAVSDDPGGPFAYLGDIRYPDGSPMLKYLTNDPAVLNDNGRIWLYYGWGLARDFRSKLFAPVYNIVQSTLFKRPIAEIKATKPSILSCAVVELEEDMITVKGEPKAVLDSKTTAPKNCELYHHAFYEAPSIRKIGDLYYLVYSSGENNELAYATSRYPDRDFQYRGVIISNSDLGYKGNTVPKAPAGTIHGGIECVNGQWYVFYHRCTNNTDFSRQACAEPITILPDGSIPQVKITTQGLSGKPILAKGSISAAYACNLTAGKTITLGIGKQQSLPRIDESDGEVYVADMMDNTQLGYKYFDFRNVQRISVTYRGAGEGSLEVRTRENCNSIGTIPIQPSFQWMQASSTVDLNGVHALYLQFRGKSRIDLKTVTFSEEDSL